MRIIEQYKHPVVGSAYLWQFKEMDYRLSALNKSPYMKFDGFTLDEARERILARGFIKLNKVFDYDR